MNTATENYTENYIGYEALVSYLNGSQSWSYLGFLELNQNTIIASLTSLTNSPITLVKWQVFDLTWYKRFLNIAKEILEPNTFDELKKKPAQALSPGALTLLLIKSANSGGGIGYLIADHSRYSTKLQTFWKGVIKKCEKENLLPTATTVVSSSMKTQSDLSKISQSDFPKTLQPATAVVSSTKKTQSDLPKTSDFPKILQPDHSKISQLDLSKKMLKISVKRVKHPMDLFTIKSKLEKNEYTELEEFEEDIRLIFCNCYTYNDVENETYYSGKALESIFNKKWNEKLILQGRQTRELKRVRDNDNDTDTDSTSFKKQIQQILEQNEDKLVYKQVINDGLLIASAYENLITGNIMPFIEILKTSLLSRSKMSLFSADEAVLQAIVESLLPLKHRVPELSLIMDGKKQKGTGRFGYSDIFVLKEIGDRYISLELKYISLVDKILEKENEKFLLERLYTYWSKEHEETKQVTINEILNNGINQLKSYMNVISKGKPVDYFSSGVFDKRIKITKSNPNKLKGFVILVVGFRRILWRSVGEVISNYNYDKI
ncbi:hypothetical protein RclHR1_04660014 [Rhizophagus clarus]|uniref:Bromo domain-containing protein n=1 Tax=Rhizophagus clarus TaxID=94130 RepID=A0A2Z6RK40_9GLOM|nr:hypothetical protein RclHR1_04660014 [Rhizophagus clarus]